MEGIGTLAFWGLSPAADLAGLVVAPELPDPNILLVGSGDPRHIICSLAKARRRPAGARVNFHVVESAMELHARTLLLLALAMEPRHALGLQEKAEFFVELFGNTLVRAKTSEYLADKAALLIKAVTDPAFAKAHLPFFDLTPLKFRERDDLEAIFKAWRRTDAASFDIRRLWDERVRAYLKTRYDARSNIADWDYNMRLLDVAPMIHPKHYETWRDRGLAFDPRDADYNQPNRSLAGEIISRDATRTKVLKRGYWGDISTGPYISFGTQCEDPAMLEKVNSRHVKTAVDITLSNVTAWLHEMLTGEPPLQPSVDRESLLKSTSGAAHADGDVDAASASGEDVAAGGDGWPVLNGSIALHSPNSLEALAGKEKYQAFFHVLYFDIHMAHLLTPSVCRLLAPCGKVVLETAKYAVDLSPEQKKAFLDKLNERATAAGLEPAAACATPAADTSAGAARPSDDFMIFVLKKL